LARARRYHHPFHLLMIDLDRFKEINDTLGHQAGDRALVEVAQTMRAEMREGDTLFRWGGDEFALILPHIPIEAARRTAERYLATVGDLRIGHLPLSLSIGIASYPEDGEDSESLLRRADDLMYRQKGERGSEGSTFEGASEGVPS
jgi:diguanylate cyclase (GGDEF)-like protein